MKNRSFSIIIFLSLLSFLPALAQDCERLAGDNESFPIDNPPAVGFRFNEISYQTVYRAELSDEKYYAELGGVSASSDAKSDLISDAEILLEKSAIAALLEITSMLVDNNTTNPIDVVIKTYYHWHINTKLSDDGTEARLLEPCDYNSGCQKVQFTVYSKNNQLYILKKQILKADDEMINSVEKCGDCVYSGNILKNLIPSTDLPLMLNGDDSQYWALTGNNLAENDFIGSAEGNNYPLVLKTNGIERMRISGEGQLIISNNSDEKITCAAPQTHRDFLLAVEGKIISQEIVVTPKTDWPDFVFEENYPLTPLEKLEQIIYSTGHLPGIPSKEEIEKNGISLAEMQAKLLKKMEEMTLYMIQLKKENEELKKRIDELEDRTDNK